MATTYDSTALSRFSPQGTGGLETAEQIARLQINSGNAGIAAKGQAALQNIQQMRTGGSGFTPDTNGQFDPTKVINNFTQNGPWKQGTQTVEATKNQLDEAFRQKQLAENSRQFNISAASDLSDRFGFGIQPKSSGENLFAQVAGKPTLGKTTADHNWQYQQGQLSNDRYNAETGRINAGTNAFNAQTDADYKQGSLAIDAAKLSQTGSASSEAINKAITYANGSIDKLTVGQKGTDQYGQTKITQVDLSPADKAMIKERFRTELLSITDAGGDPAAVLAQAKAGIYKDYGQYQGNIIYNLLQGAVGTLGE